MIKTGFVNLMILDMKPGSYKKFAEDRISYQRELAKIKGLLFD